MDVKLIEIRDKVTCIPAMAVRLRNRTPEEFFLLRRAGYGADQIGGQEESLGTLAGGREPYIILCKLDGVEAEYDPYNWRSSRTMPVAHRWLIEHWGETTSGDVLDVEFVLGESAAPRVSERLGKTNIVRAYDPEAGDRIVP